MMAKTQHNPRTYQYKVDIDRAVLILMCSVNEIPWLKKYMVIDEPCHYYWFRYLTEADSIVVD